MGCSGRGHVLVAEAGQRGAVDRVVDRSSEADVGEQWTVGVQCEEAQLGFRADEVLLVVAVGGRASGAVASGERCDVGAGRFAAGGVVGGAGLHLGDGPLGGTPTVSRFARAGAGGCRGSLGCG